MEELKALLFNEAAMLFNKLYEAEHNCNLACDEIEARYEAIMQVIIKAGLEEEYYSKAESRYK